MNYIFPSAWPLDDDYLLEVGRISVLFGALELSVNTAISKLLGYETPMDWRAAVITAHANVKQRIDILETLCHELQPEHPQLKGYASVIAKLKKAQEGRNRYLHNALGFDPETASVTMTSISARGKLTPKMLRLTIDELREVSAHIHEAMVDLHGLITGHKYPYIWAKAS
jgi:hypothetical protein